MILEMNGSKTFWWQDEPVTFTSLDILKASEAYSLDFFEVKI